VFLVKNYLNGGVAQSGDTLELDLDSVEYVEISIDNGDWVRAEGTDPWSYELDATGMEDGEYRIKARSYDGQTYSDEVSITITVGDSKVENGGEDNGGFLPGFGAVPAIAIFGIALLLSARKRFQCAK